MHPILPYIIGAVVGALVYSLLEKYIKRSHNLTHEERQEMLRKVFRGIYGEYREDNLPTNVASYAAEALDALPAAVLPLNVEGLFEDELKEWAEKNKHYRNLKGCRR